MALVLLLVTACAARRPPELPSNVAGPVLRCRIEPAPPIVMMIAPEQVAQVQEWVRKAETCVKDVAKLVAR